MWLLDKLLARIIRKGRLVVTDHDGKTYAYGPDDADPVSIRLTHAKAAGHIARHPQIGAGEAYMWGWLTIDPPHDLRDFVLFVAENAKSGGASGAFKPKGAGRQIVGRVTALIDGFNNRRAASRNVVHHYELGREFYELFLDADRQYTMAYFRDPANTLERAQLDKKALIAAKLRLDPGGASGMRVLDIGCGWGGFALYLNRHYGCEVLGVSLAPDQVRFANERAAAAGVAGKVRFETIDYRDVSGQFDRITSVGMIEHVGARHYDEYFAKTASLLDPDGIMLTHTIGRRKPGTTDAWTRKYIFPGGYIPALSELIGAIERTGWETGDVEVLRYHYALTLAEWYRRTTLHERQITAMFDAQMFRMWQFYLAGAEQAFRHGGMVNFHIQTVRRRSALPMTRDYIAAEFARLAGLDDAPQWHLDPKGKNGAGGRLP